MQTSILEGANLVNVSVYTVADWIKREMICPKNGGGVHGRKIKLDRADRVALVVVQSLRKRGLSREAIKPMSAFVSGLGDAGLSKAIRQGRTVLVNAADAVSPKMVSTAQFQKLPPGSIAVDLADVCRTAGIDLRES